MTDPTEQRFEVQHQPERSRYALVDRRSADRVVGEEDYVDVEPGAQRVFFHTVVSPEHSGQGLAGVLVRAAVEDAIARGYSIVPVCPYVAAWLPKHPEYGEHVVAPTSEHRSAVRSAENGS